MKSKSEALILIADDVAYMRLLIRNILNKNGFTKIIEASDGLETIKRVKEDKPDIIILDIYMPKIDGLSVINTVMTIEAYTKIIVCSVEKEKKVYEKAISYGAFDYIRKPLNEKELIEKVERALKSEVRHLPEKEAALGRRRDFSEKIGIKLDSSKKLQKLYLYGKLQEQEFKDLEDTVYSLQVYGYLNVIIDINGVSEINVPSSKIENLYKLIYENKGTLSIVSLKESFKNIFNLKNWEDKIKFFRTEIEAEKGV